VFLMHSCWRVLHFGPAPTLQATTFNSTVTYAVVQMLQRTITTRRRTKTRRPRSRRDSHGYVVCDVVLLPSVVQMLVVYC
jgi:hypothetical protein